MAGFDVTVCGSLHLDILVHAPALPKLDETAVGSAWQQVCGGKGGNQAVHAARAGARTAMIGRVGNDAFGATLRTNLQAAGIDVSGVSTDPVAGSGMSVAIIQDNAEYGAVIVSGSNLAMDPKAVERQWSASAGARVLVLQNEIPHPVNVAAARAAHTSGAKVVLNAAPARDLGHDLLEMVDVLVVNRVEAEALFAAPVNSRAAARLLLEARQHPVQSIVVTLGGEGLVLVSPETGVVELEPIVVKATSTHGAGDCFVGVLAARLAAGHSLAESCLEANRKAAAFVSQPR